MPVTAADVEYRSEFEFLRTPRRVAFDRVDVIAEDTGHWINYELPLATASTPTVAVRWLEQVKVSLWLPVRGLYAGVSVASQSINYEYLPARGLGFGLNAGVHTQLLMPRGIFVSGIWRWWRLRLALGVSVTSAASWARPDWSTWTVLPTLGLGAGRRNP